MPAPLEILTAYERAKKDSHKAAAMAGMGIPHIIRFWATATEDAKNIAIGFLREPEVPASPM